jgi:hypothetical protein
MLQQRKKCVVFHPGRLSRPNRPKRLIPKKIPKPSLFKGPKTGLANVGTILPLHKFDPSIGFMLQFTGSSFSSRQDSISSMRETMVRLGKYPLYRPYAMMIKEKIHVYRPWIRKEQRIRTLLRCLVRCWILKKYEKRKLNTEDPVTMCEPEKPVQVFDMRLKGSYTFDIQTIKKTIEEDLVYSEWMFPKPKSPKNPFTNLPFTCGQMIKLIDSINKYGTSSWILEAYKSSHYDTDNFLMHYSIPIRMHGLKSIIRNKTSDEFQEFLIEFIEESYEYHDIQYTSHLNILKWAVFHAIEDPYMKKWINIFKRYHEYSILNGKEDSQKDEFLDETQTLLDDSVSIAKLGRERLNSISRVQTPARAPVQSPLQQPTLLAGVVLNGSVIQRINTTSYAITILSTLSLNSEEDDCI